MKIENLHLSSIKYFLDTVETASFTEAASRNHVTRPAISQAIRRLEDWCGFQLVAHEKRTFKLTKDGEDFYRRAKRSYAAFGKELVEGHPVVGSLKLGCSASLIDLFLTPSLKKLKDPFKLQIKTGTSSQLKQLLEEGQLHVALFVDDNPLVPGIESEVLSRGLFVLAAKSGKLESLLITTEDRPEVIALRNHFSKKDIQAEVVRTESWSVSKKLAEALGGACLIPEFLMSSPFKPVRLPGFRHDYQVILAHQRPELMSEAEVALCELLRKVN